MKLPKQKGPLKYRVLVDHPLRQLLNNEEFIKVELNSDRNLEPIIPLPRPAGE